jgi:hypothetical protein
MQCNECNEECERWDQRVDRSKRVKNKGGGGSPFGNVVVIS